MKVLTNKCFEKLKWLISKITYKMIIIVIGIILISLAFTSFKIEINRKINDNTKVYLSSILDESLDRVSLKINEEINILKTISLFFNNVNDLSSNISVQQLNDQLNLHEFKEISLLGNNGDVIYSVGNTSNIERKEYIAICKQSGHCISSVIIDENNEEYIDFSVPLYHKGVSIGILICSYDMNEFTEIIESSYFEKIGTTFISQEDGTLISRPKSVGEYTNLFKLLDSINTYNEKSILKLKNSIQNEESGIITYGNGKHKRYICYNVIPETSWYSVSIISSSAIEPVAKNISELAIMLAKEIILIFSLYIGVIIFVEYRKLRRKKYSISKENKN